MKVRFYVDLYSGMDPARYGLLATTQPCAKTNGCKRIAFDVTISDSLLFGLDEMVVASTPTEIANES